MKRPRPTQGIKLYQTVRRDGKFFLSGYVLTDSYRENFSMVEQTADEAFARLYRLQSQIDEVHPRRNAN